MKKTDRTITVRLSQPEAHAVLRALAGIRGWADRASALRKIDEQIVAAMPAPQGKVNRMLANMR